MSQTPELIITQPDDWHVHLRDGALLRAVAAHTAERFARAIVMPNLKPPIRTTAQALAYRQRILAALPPGQAFEPLMTLYLTDATPPSEIEAAKASGQVHAAKLYPAGATTNADQGVTALERIAPVLAAMERVDLPLLIHGEVTDPDVDIFDREPRFIERHLAGLLRDFPGLRVVLEHVTTSEAVDFVRAGPARLAATITAHHLLFSRNAMLVGGIRPHFYCLPVLKRERHRQTLISAATSGEPRFFLGTDSAPHPASAKEGPCGCAGLYTAHAALELYAEVFEQAGALDRLEGFASHFGADFYRLPRNPGKIRLRRHPTLIPATIPAGPERIIPLRAGEAIPWSIAG